MSKSVLAHTRWSLMFLGRLYPVINWLRYRFLVDLDLPRISQFFLTVAVRLPGQGLKVFMRKSSGSSSFVWLSLLGVFVRSVFLSFSRQSFIDLSRIGSG